MSRFLYDSRIFRQEALMRPYAALALSGAILVQGSPLFAQGALGVDRFRIAQGPAAVSTNGAGERRASQAIPVVHVHHNVSIRRMAVGALIGGAAGAAVGYGLGSRCGATCSPQERAGYGRLGAVVLGGVGVFLGVHIAVGNP